MSNAAEIKPFGENTFLIEWSDEISEFNHLQVTAVNQIIKECFGHNIIETTPSYQSIAIYLKENTNTSSFIKSISELLNEDSFSESVTRREVHIPVCYDQEFGLDLAHLAEYHDLSIKSIIAHHTKEVYPVYFIGFLPGFPYLEGLNPMIATPRKEKPRSVVHAGSVGIAGNQTGVYPMDSPGGWNIIGRSPISFFDINNENPSLLQVGDQIKFFEISKEDYDKIEKEVKNNTYQLKTIAQDD